MSELQPFFVAGGTVRAVALPAAVLSILLLGTFYGACPSTASQPPRSEAAAGPGSATEGGIDTSRPSPCDPLADTCPSGEACNAFDDDGRPICAPEGTARLGQTCQQGACARGSICAGLSEATSCREACDPRDPRDRRGCRTPDQLCLPITGAAQPVGACFENTRCSPVNDTCPSGQACYQVPGGSTCTTEGERGLGERCGAQGDCKRGLICAEEGARPKNLADKVERVAACHQACNGSRPCDVGVCFQSGFHGVGGCTSR